MKGHEYRDRIAEFIVRNFEQRGLKVYTEVSIGRSVGGTARRVDLFLLHSQRNKACVIECKLQESAGTADQKLMYALQDVEALRLPGFIVYAGKGISDGIRHKLECAASAVYALPRKNQVFIEPNVAELVQALALEFGWFDLLVQGKQAVRLQAEQVSAL
mgnify:FL=1